MQYTIGWKTYSGTDPSIPHSLRVCRNNCRVPTERALNLGASMGDLLFKLQPESPVICSEPDVTFMRIPDDGKVMLLMASDGLFNYLPESLNKDKHQNDFLVKKCVQRQAPTIFGLGRSMYRLIGWVFDIAEFRCNRTSSILERFCQRKGTVDVYLHTGSLIY